MSERIATLVNALQPDPWRTSNGFSPDLEEVHKHVFVDSVSPDTVTERIGGWLQRFQPCLFGRIAAKHGQLSYCVIVDSELDHSDEYIRDKIQNARLKWTTEGFNGAKSGFVVLIVSQRIAKAIPNDQMKALSRELCSLYLLDEIAPDRIYLDEVFLEMPGNRRTSWVWNSGVNYFCAQGDKRWWNDHRIPGGMAFSVNSVGHMVKSGMLARGTTDLAELMGAPGEKVDPQKLETLGDALTLAMRTITKASEAVSGRATWLLPIESADELPKCPVELPQALQNLNYCMYQGRYHTDYTLPSEYFLPDVERPVSVQAHDLDFTYLFDDSLDNPDYVTMGTGRMIRGLIAHAGPDAAEELLALALHKRSTGIPRVVAVDTQPRLTRALTVEI